MVLLRMSGWLLYSLVSDNGHWSTLDLLAIVGSRKSNRNSQFYLIYLQMQYYMYNRKKSRRTLFIFSVEFCPVTYRLFMCPPGAKLWEEGEGVVWNSQSQRCLCRYKICSVRRTNFILVSKNVEGLILLC